jgi:Na+/H+-dicarboxylate symporter
MSKLFAALATLKAIFIATSVALARGDMLPVILISMLFSLAHLGAKPSNERVQRDMVTLRSHDQSPK